MATLKEVQTKIKAVKKTKQITKAMYMVATSRLRGAQNAMAAFRPYAGKFAEVLGSLSAKAGEDGVHPLLLERTEIKKVHLIICTSDRGLCGGFNGNLISKAEAFIKAKSRDDIAVSVTNFGKKGRDNCRRRKVEIADQYLGVVGSRFGFNIASKTGKKVIDAFLAAEYDEVYIIYSEFINMARQVPVLKQLLPIPPIVATENAKSAEDEIYMPEHICEPSPDELLADMLPRNIFVQIHSALLETSTSEHAARMAAMDNATKACNDIVENLTLVYNKARQSAITADLMDIVGGAEALKG